MVDAQYRSIRKLSEWHFGDTYLRFSPVSLSFGTLNLTASGQQFYGGTALYFALFCEVASRDEQTNGDADGLSHHDW